MATPRRGRKGAKGAKGAPVAKKGKGKGKAARRRRTPHAAPPEALPEALPEPPAAPIDPADVSPEAPGPGGRPSKFTPRTIARVLERIRQGSPDVRAARLAGISYELLRQWKEAGHAAAERDATGAALSAIEAAKLAFLADYTEAKERHLADLEDIVATGAKKDAKLALEVLARRDPEEWGRRGTVSIANPDGTPIVFEARIPKPATAAGVIPGPTPHPPTTP